MAKDFARPFYRSRAWRAAREAYIGQRRSIDGGMCEVCGERIGFIVHHIVELTPENIADSQVTLAFDNLLFVCKECHDRFEGHFFGFSRKIARKCSVMFDEEGQPVPPIL